VAGAVATMLGFVTVPFVLILIIAAFLTNFADNPYVQHAFAGIRVCVCVLILQAVLRLWKKSVVDRRTLILYTVILLLQVFSSFLPLSVPAAMLVIASGIFGLFLCPGKEEAE
jgi:chromate transporter